MEVCGERTSAGGLAVSTVRIDGTFDVVGARRALQYFSTLDEARLAHGYLFAGPSGIGKKTFARRLAQSLLCEHPKSTLLGYDDTCRSCILFRAGTHPDYHETIGLIKIGEPQRDAPEEEATSRGIVHEMSLRPYIARWRVAMLGDVAFTWDDAPAAHALLKLLEEPMPNVLFILTTDSPRALLPTIRSRMIEIAFDLLANADVAEVLRRDGVPEKAAEIAAASSLGSIVRARSIAAGEESGFREASVAWFVDALQGREPEQLFLGLDDKSVSAAERRELVREMLDVVGTVARDWAALGIAGTSVPLLAADVRTRIAALPQRPPAAIVDVLGAIGRANELSRTNVSASLVLDYLRMHLAPSRG